MKSVENFNPDEMVILYHWRVKHELFIQMITEVNFKTKAVLLPSRRGLSRVEASEYVGVSPNTFDRMIGDGKMPSAVQIYGRKVWDVRALDRAFDALSGLAPVIPFVLSETTGAPEALEVRQDNPWD